MNDTGHFDGIYTPVITPYRADGAIDYPGLETVIEFLVESGVHGIICGGTTGEYYAQTLQERIALIHFTQTRLAGRLPLTVGTGAIRQADSLALARCAREVGADSILIGSPPYALPTEQENALNALAIDHQADLPIMLYNYPDRMGVAMGEVFLNHVSRSGNLCGIKESSGDINRIHRLTHDYPSIRLGCGMDDQALEFLAWGARFWVCAGANFLPREHLALHRACVIEGDFTKGRQIMSAMLPLMWLLEQSGQFVQTIKQGVALAGLPSGPPRPPLKALNQANQNTLAQTIATLKTTLAAIDNPD